MTGNILGILWYLLIWGCILAVLWWGAQKLSGVFPTPFMTVATVILVVLTVVVLINLLLSLSGSAFLPIGVPHVH